MKGATYIFCFFLSLISMAQQDPLYSQYQFNQLMINPAYAGVYNRFSAGLISRYQWAGINGAPQTNTLTAQSSFKDGRIGFGGVILNDQFGVSSNYEMQLAGSYNIRFEESLLAMGLQGGWIQYGYDFNNVELDFIDDPELLNGHDTFSKPNFGMGVMYMSNTFFVGASVPRILNVSVSDGALKSERYKRHYYFTTGATFDLYESPIKIQSLVRSMNGENLSVDITGSVFLEDILWVGITARDFRHYGFFGILEISDKLKLGYSFELPTNSLIHGSLGTHEISFTYSVDLIKRPMFRDRYF